jgi:acetylornithine deacetylase
MERHGLAPLEILRRLIVCDTVSSRSNLALIDFVQDYLADFGVACELVPNENGTKANLLATIGPPVDGGLILSGHTDVVPVEGQAWQSDPFRLHEADDKLYGRGTCDMKGFIAAALALVPELAQRQLTRPVHLALSYDEEVGCLGVHRLLDRLRQQPITPLGAIIGEPTDLRLIDLHKGIQLLKTTVRGRSAHSSRPELGENAIFIAAKLVRFLEEKATALALSPTADRRFATPYITLNVGTIEGGTATNIIPEHCSFCWEFRAPPGADPEEVPRALESYLANELPQAQISTERTVCVAPLLARRESAVFALVATVRQQTCGDSIAYVTEAGLFQRAGFDAVVCGPGSVEQAHQPNEYLERSAFEQGISFVRQAVGQLVA